MVMKTIASLVLAAAVFAAATPAAEPTGQPVPDGFAYAVSIPSTVDLVDRLDAFVAACTRKTQNELPEGMTKALAQLFIPGIAVALDNDLELHLLAPVKDGRTGIPGVVVAGVDLETFSQILADNAIDAESGEDGTLRVMIPHLPPLIARDAGGNHTLLAVDPAVLDLMENAVENGWRADAKADLDLVVAVAVAKNWRGEIMENDDAEKKLERLRADVLSDTKLSHELRRFLDDILAACAERIPALKHELASIDSAILEIGLDADAASFFLRTRSPEGTFLGTMASAAEKLADLEPPLLKRIGNDAAAVGAVAPLEQAFPGLIAAGLGLYESIAEKDASPEVVTAMENLKALGDANFGAAVVAQYLHNGRLLQICWLDTDDPARLLGLYVDSYLHVNSLAASLDPAMRDNPPVSRTSGKTPGGTEYQAVSFSPEFMAALIRAFSGNADDLPAGEILDAFGGYTYYLTALDGRLVLASGLDGPEALDAALKIGDDDSDPMWESAPVQRALARMPARQSAVAFVDYALLMNHFSIATLENLAANLEPDDGHYAKAIEEVKSKTRLAHSRPAFAQGAADGELVWQCVVPADTVNIVYYNMSILFSAMESARENHAIQQYEEEEDRPESGE